MSKKQDTPTPQPQDEQPQSEQPQAEAAPQQEGEGLPDGEHLNRISVLEEEVSAEKDKALRLLAEVDNIKRRTAREKQEFLATATEALMAALLPVLDDMERAKAAMEKSEDIAAVKDGLELVFGKLLSTLTAKGLAPFDTVGEDFDAETQEAITQIPAPSDEMKGKVVDQVERGYKLGEKVIRYAKVVVGA